MWWESHPDEIIIPAVTIAGAVPHPQVFSRLRTHKNGRHQAPDQTNMSGQSSDKGKNRVFNSDLAYDLEAKMQMKVTLELGTESRHL